MYDVVIAGGSIAGLLTAREIANDGHSVLVLEEGFEIGTPEHCGGLVSKKALNELGVELSAKSYDSEINTAKILCKIWRDATRERRAPIKENRKLVAEIANAPGQYT